MRALLKRLRSGRERTAEELARRRLSRVQWALVLAATAALLAVGSAPSNVVCLFLGWSLAFKAPDWLTYWTNRRPAASEPETEESQSGEAPA